MSTKRSKRYQEAAKLVIPNKNYSITEAVETMKSFPAPKFDPTVTVSFHLTVDPRKSDQMVRGSVSLPNGTGKKRPRPRLCSGRCRQGRPGSRSRIRGV